MSKTNQSKLLVYPTMRAMLSALSTNESNLSVDLIAIESFFSKSCFVENKFMLSSEQKYMYLSEIIEDIDVSPLGISNDFLFFLKNKDILFKFFNEVYNEDISFEDIKNSDIYEEFIEHIEILELVYDKYQEKLSQNNVYDPSSKEEFLINESYIKSFDEIYIFVEGYFSKQELNLLDKLSKLTNIVLEINSTRYNKKVVKDLSIEEPLNKLIIYNLSKKKALSISPLKTEKDLYINAYPIYDNISEAHFVFYKINEYIKSGISPQNIVVILPKEDFANKLRAFDKENNLNFAMGISFIFSKTYIKLNTLYNYLLDNKEENNKKMEIYGLDDYKNGTKKTNSIDDIFDLLEATKDNESKNIIDILIFSIKRIKNKLSKYKFIEILSYILSELQSKSIDDNTGGKIRVMGLLESRNMNFEAIIIANFNNKKAPKYSKKDIFLNSKIKEIVKMPTRQDRYDLQKYFYYRLLQNSKNISISYIENEKETKSTLLSELEFHKANIKYHKTKTYFTKELSSQEIKYNFTKNKKLNELSLINKNLKVSFSKLNVFISCKRKFYLQYNEKISKKEIEILPSISIAGSKIHALLATLAKEGKLNTFKKEILKLSSEQRKYSYYFLSSYLSADKINKIEQGRAKDGYKIFSIEDDFEVNYKGVILKGRIDRIDIKDNNLYIIDYKYHNQVKPKELKKHTLQLTLYMQAMKIKYPQYEVHSAGIYDLKFGKLSFLNEYDADVLDKELLLYKEKFTIDKCENKHICSYCPYSVICDRM